ncbi:hypothetical protein, partial [Sinomonas sp. ASV322]|uniref:hypothetical protein n=1 Tax=Sinomonas sp. ASV322 TaxID=3041920 RepID=UPI0027DDCED0
PERPHQHQRPIRALARRHHRQRRLKLALITHRRHHPGRWGIAPEYLNPLRSVDSQLVAPGTYVNGAYAGTYYEPAPATPAPAPGAAFAQRPLISDTIRDHIGVGGTTWADDLRQVGINASRIAGAIAAFVPGVGGIGYVGFNRLAGDIEGQDPMRPLTADDGAMMAIGFLPGGDDIAGAIKGAEAAGSELAEGFNSFRAAKRALPSPGTGNVYDHIVEQSQIGRSGFDPAQSTILTI